MKSHPSATAFLDSLRSTPVKQKHGYVWLVGAGPGDPDLLTVKALRLLQSAQTVLYDALVSPDILALIPASAHCISVGKRASKHSLPQTDICELMVRLAQRGQNVIRLKGGDPFIFGRGGEEIQALQLAGIDHSVVPGISAAQAAGAGSCIPLTHRDVAQTLVYATGHRQTGSSNALNLDWNMLARPHQTVVIYMGLGQVDTICQQLQQHGLAPSHPAAVIEKASTAQERCIVGHLTDLPQLVIHQQVQAPALLIIGDVVQFYRENKQHNTGQNQSESTGSDLLSLEMQPKLGLAAQ